MVCLVPEQERSTLKILHKALKAEQDGWHGLSLCLSLSFLFICLPLVSLVVCV